MADNLTDVAEARTLNWLTGNAGAAAPVLPLALALLSALGTDSAPGVEVAGGGYARQPVAFPAAAAGGPVPGNTADVLFVDMPAVNVAGYEVYDSAGTRWWHGAAAAAKAVPAGEDYRVPAGALTLALG